MLNKLLSRNAEEKSYKMKGALIIPDWIDHFLWRTSSEIVSTSDSYISKGEIEFTCGEEYTKNTLEQMQALYGGVAIQQATDYAAKRNASIGILFTKMGDHNTLEVLARFYEPVHVEAWGEPGDV